MSSAFDIQASAAFAQHLSHFGGSITYQSKDTDAVSLQAILGDAGLVSRMQGDTEVYVQSRTAKIRTDPAATEGGVADPVRGANVVIGGVVWFVDAVELESGSIAMLSLVLAEAHEVMGRQVRKK